MTAQLRMDAGRTAWMDHANCLGLNPDLFFLERSESVTEATAVCAGCPVRIECLAYAFTNREQHGIWGGTSAKERRRMRSQTVFAQLRNGAA